MGRTYAAEDRAEELERLIDVRIAATESAILANRTAIVASVAGLCNDLNCDEDEAAALVRSAVIGRSQLVGVRIAEEVRHAIYQYALPLAEGDLADAERNRAESADDNRIAMVECDRAAA